MIYWPAEFPCFLLENHEGQDEDIYARTEVDFGPARLRRKYRVVPHQRKAEIFFHGDQPAAFHYFFENDLDRGQRRFMAPFQAIEGSEIRFFETEFVEPYEAEFVLLAEAKRAWRVKCKFRLYGEGKIDSGAMLPADMSMGLRVILRGKSRIEAPANLALSCGVELKGVVGQQSMDVGFGIELKGRVADATALPNLGFLVALAGTSG